MLYVVIPKSLITFIPIMSVPTFEIGEKVINELKEICSDEIFAMVGGTTVYPDVQPYTDWSWKFQSEE
jgi:hypothetical protein